MIRHRVGTLVKRSFSPWRFISSCYNPPPKNYSQLTFKLLTTTKWYMLPFPSRCNVILYLTMCDVTTGCKLSCNKRQRNWMSAKNNRRGNNSMNNDIFMYFYFINEFRCYEVKIEWKGWQPPGVEPMQDTSGLSHQCSATDSWQPDDHQPSQSSILVLNASVATQYVPSELQVRGQPENSLHQERTPAEWFSHSKCSEYLASWWK